MRIALASLSCVALTACAPSSPDPSRDTSAFYSTAEESGLIALGPFPGPDDVCRLIGENTQTNAFLDDSAVLIGCPNIETEAIADRVAEGATLLESVGDWTLLSVPNS